MDIPDEIGLCVSNVWAGWRKPRRCWKPTPKERYAFEKAEYDAKLPRPGGESRTHRP